MSMEEKLIDLFFYNWILSKIDFLNLYNYFHGLIWYKYIFIWLLNSLISVTISTSIGLLFIKIWSLFHKYFNIKNNLIINYKTPFVVSILFWILYPIYCLIFGISWWKISKYIVLCIAITHLFIEILLTILNLNMLWYL